MSSGNNKLNALLGGIKKTGQSIFRIKYLAHLHNTARRDGPIYLISFWLLGWSCSKTFPELVEHDVADNFLKNMPTNVTLQQWFIWVPADPTYLRGKQCSREVNRKTCLSLIRILEAILIKKEFFRNVALAKNEWKSAGKYLLLSCFVWKETFPNFRIEFKWNYPVNCYF